MAAALKFFEPVTDKDSDLIANNYATIGVRDVNLIIPLNDNATVHNINTICPFVALNNFNMGLPPDRFELLTNCVASLVLEFLEDETFDKLEIFERQDLDDEVDL